MAEIRCPMCGKSNPEELEVCQFCQARLKPLKINSQDSSEDWLQPANGDERNDQNELSQPEAPDWLRSLRSREVSIEDTTNEPAMSDPAEWLRGGMGDPDLLGSQRTASNDSNWLADFRSEDSSQAPTDHEIPEADDGVISEPTTNASNFVSDVPDWLTGVRQETEPEHLDRLEAEIHRPDEEIEPEWLAQLRAHREIESTEQLPEPASDDVDLPDWLKSGDLNLESDIDAISSQSHPAEEAATWTSYFSQDTAASADNENAEESMPGFEEPILPESDLPDWLQDAEEKPVVSEDPTQSEETVDSNTQNDDAPPWYATVPGRPIKPTDQLSQWLRLETTEPDNSETLPQEELSDWLKVGHDGEPAISQALDEFADEPESISIDHEELSNISFDTARAIDTPDFPPHITDDEASMDDEFASLEKALFSGGEVDAQSPTIPQPQDSGLVPGVEPSWLVELRQKMGSTGEQDEPKVAPFSEDGEHELPAEDSAGQELPDWLIDVHAQEAIEQIAEASVPLEPVDAEVAETGVNLAQADLPAWLEAMRPVEAVAAAASDLVDERDQSVESAGPLAGIKGVLPAESDFKTAHKPGSFGLKLQISDMQRARADMLQELIQKETYSRPVPRKPAISSQRVLQIIIAATLILAILSTLVIDTTIAKVPGFPPETQAVSEWINTLGNADRVLVAVDFQPSFSGEMEASGATVMDHLMLRGVHLTIVSTHPTGPIQAERLINLVNQRYGHTYGDSQVSNLGYISGGRSGLLAFASSPRLLAPVTLDTGTNPWDGGSLQGVSRAADFAMTLVITENPDTARMWIEQYQPHLAGKPLLMILSAQAQPIVRPYYEGSPQQVQGIVSGTAGAAAYENLLGRVGIARNHWGAYSLAILAACILIIIGAIINVMPFLSTRTKNNKSGGEDQL